MTNICHVTLAIASFGVARYCKIEPSSGKRQYSYSPKLTAKHIASSAEAVYIHHRQTLCHMWCGIQTESRTKSIGSAHTYPAIVISRLRPLVITCSSSPTSASATNGAYQSRKIGFCSAYSVTTATNSRSMNTKLRLILYLLSLHNL